MRVAEREDATVARDQPIPAIGRGRCHREHGLVQAPTAHAAEERGAAVPEDAAIGTDEPIAVARARADAVDDGTVQRESTRIAVPLRRSGRRDAAVRVCQPEAVPARGREAAHRDMRPPDRGRVRSRRDRLNGRRNHGDGECRPKKAP